MRPHHRERGSILLFTLFVCLAIAVVIQTLSVVVICAQRGRDVENAGRGLLAATDGALAGVRQRLAADWAPFGRTESGEDDGGVWTNVADLPASGGWALY